MNILDERQIKNGSYFQKVLQHDLDLGKIQVLKTDNARNYFNSILGEFLLRKDMVHQNSCIDNPQQIGIAKRKNRHLLEVVRALMFSTHVTESFWGEAVLIATYLINRMSSCVLSF